MIDEGEQVENELKKIGVLQDEEDEENPQFPVGSMKKLQISKKSSFFNFEIEEEQEHMFCIYFFIKGDDSSYNNLRARMTGI